jgi:hypothetical protein
MIVELARRVSSCGWVALCERRRAGFARLLGWQPVGNWVASAANFPASRAGASVHVFSSQEGRNHPPRRGSFFIKWRGHRATEAAKAIEMAGEEIDRLGDPLATEEERQLRKRRLIKGPQEFRDIRINRAKEPGIPRMTLELG